MHEPLDNKHNHLQPPAYEVALTSLLLSAALPISIILFCIFYLATWYWSYEPLHSLIESLGSFAAITLALFILIMRRNRQLRPRYLWIASTLMGMGVLDLFHASMPPGKVFIWLHCLATLFGGLTVALVLLPERLASFPMLQSLPCATGMCSTFIGTLSFFYPEYLPVMEKKETFSLVADSMNAIGGLGFLLAWFHFCVREPKEQHQHENNILANFFLLFAVAALLFKFSTLWGAVWWLMHLVRLVAYLALLRFFLKIYSRDIGRIRKSRLKLKKRTQELERTQSHLSDIIEYSPAAITLRDITGKFILVNRKFSGLFPNPHKEMIGKTAANIFPNDIAQQQRYEDDKVIQQGTPTEVEEEYPYTNGQKRTFIVERFPLKYPDNKTYGVGSVMTEISERKKVETERKKLLAENTERIKELNCLYGLSRLAENTNAKLIDILDATAELIASSWQHAQHAGARIILDDYDTSSKNFKETQWIQEAPVLLNNEIRGRVQICYTRRFPDDDEGPFLKEERHLINEVAVRLGNIIQRKNAETELRKSLEFNNKIIEEFPVGLSVYNREGISIATNSSMKKITGFSKEQKFCPSYNKIDYWQKTGLCEAAKQSLALHKNISHNFKLGDFSSETLQFFKAILVPFMLHDEQRLLLMIEDVTERKKAEEDLKSALLEKESLLKEIHHRVKNNMQIAASLMFLQAQSVENTEALRVLQDSQERIKSMGLVHELLYRSGNFSKVPFSEYIEALVQSLQGSYTDYNQRDISFLVEAEGIALPVNTAVPCGLIMNELITNSFKYAFPDNRSGKIYVHFVREDDLYILTMRDNGIGLPVDYNWQSAKSLGLNLVRNLAGQLDAEVRFENDNGLKTSLVFKAPDAQMENNHEQQE